MDRALPGLSGLIDFEAAARAGSFRLAAQELHKTAAAVSQQIKHLEGALGFALFVRHPRRVTITAQGLELAATLTRVLGELNAKVAALRAGDAEAQLRVSTTHSFAMKWLVPRLHRFTERHPELDVRVDASDAPVDLAAGRFDVAIRYGREATGASVLLRDRLVVVYSPDLRRRPGSPPLGRGATLSALARYPLLFEGHTDAWRALLAANGVASRRCDFSRAYSHAGLLVQAAVAAHGVALAPFSLAHADLAAGRLIRGTCEPLDSGYAYHLLLAPGTAASQKVEPFAQWLRSEVAAMDATPHGRGRAGS